MAKDMAAYQQLVMMNPQNMPPGSAEEVLRGMSDEEEMRRIGLNMIGGNPLGEVLVDTEREAEELGFKK